MHLFELEKERIHYSSFGDSEAKKAALSEPTFDYFGDQPYAMRRPKATVGSYIAEHSKDLDVVVPLVTTHQVWQNCLENGNAMIRSESPDEYSGYRGLFTSARVPERYLPENDFYSELGSLILRGLKDGVIEPVDYMNYFAGRHLTWPQQLNGVHQTAQRFNLPLDLESPEASLWEYIPGSNVSIFGDPHVEGRYHIGYKPPSRIIGGLTIEPGMHTKEHRFRKHDHAFIAQPFIEAYEAIAALPLFDTEQRPVLELQLSTEGVMHFLQYYKTGHQKAYTEPFELPFSPKEDIKLNMVRGITPPEGRHMRLFVAPKRLLPAMVGEGVYCGIIDLKGVEAQFVSKNMDFFLHQAYISFQDNHFDSSPLFMPPLAAGLNGYSEDTSWELFTHATERLQSATYKGYHDYNNVQFFNIHVTSNGHEVVLRSDWNPHVVSYRDCARM